jgi:hypothetical protein
MPASMQRITLTAFSPQSVVRSGPASPRSVTPGFMTIIDS